MSAPAPVAIELEVHHGEAVGRCRTEGAPSLAEVEAAAHAGPEDHHVLPGAAVEPAAPVRQDHVVAVAAAGSVVGPRADVEHVVAVAAREQVLAAVAVNAVVARRSDQVGAAKVGAVVSVGAMDRGHRVKSLIALPASSSGREERCRGAVSPGWRGGADLLRLSRDRAASGIGVEDVAFAVHGAQLCGAAGVLADLGRSRRMRMSIERSPGASGRPCASSASRSRVRVCRGWRAKTSSRSYSIAVSAISAPSGSRRQRASVSKVQRPMRTVGRGAAASGDAGGIRRRTARMRASSSRGSKGLTT